MTPQRVDLFAVIHKMLRVSLFDTASLIAQTDFSSEPQRVQVLDKLRETVAFLAEHHEHEDTHVIPVVRQIDAALAESIDSDHTRLNQTQETLNLIATKLEEVDAVAALALGAELHLAFSVFIGDYLRHMASEEVELNAALWKHLDDQALAGIRAELQGAIPPPRFAEWFAYMVPAMNLHERVGILTDIKLNAPPAAFEALGGVARTALGEQKWQQVESSLPA